MNIYLSSVIKLLEEVYAERRKRTPCEKARDSHDRQSNHHVILHIHIEEQQECGSHARQEYDEYREQIDVFFHKIE